MWDQLFAVTNLAAVIGWAVLVVGPVQWRPVVRYAVVGFLAAVYLLIFGLLFAGHGDAAGGLPEYSVAGLRKAFASDAVMVLGWTHYLAFDLFVGCWIAEDADKRGVGRIARVPVLFATFMAGPIGLLVWYFWRRLVPARIAAR